MGSFHDLQRYLQKAIFRINLVYFFGASNVHGVLLYKIFQVAFGPQLYIMKLIKEINFC